MMSRCKVFRISQYEKFFNVETETVLSQIKLALIPFSLGKIFSENSDLYGPILMSFTLVFTQSIFSSISSLFNPFLEFSFISLLVLVLLVNFIIFLFPLLIYLVLAHSQAIHLRILNSYSYSFSPIIPAFLLCLFDYDILRWVLCLLAMSLSWIGLFTTIFTQITSTTKRKIFGFLIGAFGHLSFALFSKLAIMSNNSQ